MLFKVRILEENRGRKSFQILKIFKFKKAAEFFKFPRNQHQIVYVHIIAQKGIIILYFNSTIVPQTLNHMKIQL